MTRSSLYFELHLPVNAEYVIGAEALLEPHDPGHDL